MNESVTNQELARELEAVKTRVGQLERQRNDAIDALADATGLSRRQVLGIIGGGAGMGALGMLAVGDAQAAAQPNGGDGDVGTTASPFEGFADGLAMVAQDISSATTVTKPIVRYDPSVSGFTITLGQELEGPSGFVQPIVLEETGGSSNQVTVDTESGNGINGGASITLNQPNAVTFIFWNGSEFRTHWFTQTVDVGTLTVDGDQGIGVPATSADAGLTLGGGFTQLDANRPVFLFVRAVAETDGTSNGEVEFRVDESGGTTSDYNMNVFADSTLAAGTRISNGYTILIPAGAQVNVANASDPNNANTLALDRKFTL